MHRTLPSACRLPDILMGHLSHVWQIMKREMQAWSEKLIQKERCVNVSLPGTFWRMSVALYPDNAALASCRSFFAPKGGVRVLLQGLMKLLQAGERPEAPQPAGLTVQLHPYQRQSLRFMLDNERGEGGHRRHFWVPFRTPSGFAFWYSPVFLRACVDVPPAPWGGILAEQMVRTDRAHPCWHTTAMLHLKTYSKLTACKCMLA